MQYNIVQHICELFHFHKNVDYGNVCYYNTAYDKELVPAIDSFNVDYPDTLGVTAITDRRKILHFLDLLSRSNKYDYIILDIFFDKNDVTEIDDSLYAKIRSMERIVIAGNEDLELPQALSDYENIALVSYPVTDFSTSFARYKYTEADRRSIPMHIYEKKHPEKVMKRYGYGLFSLYFSGGRLCQNSLFLTFDDYQINRNVIETENEGQDVFFSTVDYVNLGEILNNSASDRERIIELGSVTKGKIVLISDLINDTHDTYVGEKSGALILTRALQMLEEKKNIVSFWHNFIWFVIFTVISIVIYRDKPLSMQIPFLRRLLNGRFYHMLISLFTYTLVILICSSIEYALVDRVYSFVVPLIIFAFIKLKVQYKKFDSV